jgi:hypothetical protein
MCGAVRSDKFSNDFVARDREAALRPLFTSGMNIELDHRDRAPFGVEERHV